jgi:hypothetical protein
LEADVVEDLWPVERDPRDVVAHVELHELEGHACDALGGCCALSIKARKPSRQREHRHQQYAEFVGWRHLRGLASPDLMFDFSSNHFQKAKAILTLLQDDRCNGCATQETGAFLCCVANTRSVTIDIGGGATMGLCSVGGRDALN